MSQINKCVSQLGPNLKKRGITNHEKMATQMCSMWADENGVEKEFGVAKAEETQKTFALDFKVEDVKLDEEVKEFTVKAITSGAHEYEKDGKDHKVYIEPNMLKDNIELFKELPIYVNHQRTPEDLIGKAINPEVEELDNGKIAIKMLAQISEPTEKAHEVIGKVKDGDITNVSIDWFSKDVDVMGDIYATNIRPVEVSFIENDKMEAVCGECTIDKECNTHEPEQVEKEFAQEPCCNSCSSGGTCNDNEKEVDSMSEEVKHNDSDKIVEREFANLKTQLAEMEKAHTELTSKYEAAIGAVDDFKAKEEERKAAEADRRKKTLVNNIISKQVLIGSVKEESKDDRFKELEDWDETKLVGFSEALENIPTPESEKSFGKGIAADSEEKAVEEEEETERLFGMASNGEIRLNRKALNRGE
mgnify:CR=1 FL=1|tara:strand:+ start:996 stop:2249 length:1254 start_codon:yes stop_codon:yes gene_type:complete